ncbi:MULTISPECIES: phosphotransferase system, HPr-related protein [Pseudomonas]|uniref:phosphotransferase system, HPr-related protein n=1 Tax=Pseudomonas TaxID=286 RepID=UPI000DA680A0|nr:MULTISPECIES: phosphotransferase system, HPr-related protein [Pseudomonas]MCU1720314.1 phosphotransferase system, HPr-related protein [Pseudomonas sp. 5P_5.1_Bac1]MCU1731814.1 phosphotransferase system, HPr-related protein [Pseudomonas sp. 20P_3.2_Bac4]MCU1743249.1 phosphotransferase system, HPr-related protein [Pseudomonas sp. 20P_3.2_Bac5]
MIEKSDKPAEATPHQAQEIDDIQDRMGEMRELDFSDRNDERQGRAGDARPGREVDEEFPRERVERSGMSGGETLTESQHEDNVNYDDLSPDTLYDQTGARDAFERGGDGPADQELRRVDGAEIGGGLGLDEAELARSAPLDGKPWTDRVSPAEGDDEEQ